MKLPLDHIRNKGKGKTAFVVGLGCNVAPSLDALNKISKDKENYVTISCNYWDQMMPDLSVDYWVMASTVVTVGQMYDRYNNKKATIIYEEGLDWTPREKVDELLIVDYLPYDQRHIHGKCTGGKRNDGTNWCCDFYIEERKTLQTYFAEITEIAKVDAYLVNFSMYGNVSLNMVMVAVILGCDPIFIFGVDLDYSTPYVDGSYNYAWEREKRNQLQIESKGILKGLEVINKCAENINVDIYNMDEKSPLKQIFKTIKF